MYGECDGDIAFMNWSTSEGEVTLAFSLESGELVHGSAKLYAYDYCDEAASPSARIETDGQFEPSSCRTCDLTDYCAGEDVATIDCLVDGEGRVTLPD